MVRTSPLRECPPSAAERGRGDEAGGAGSQERTSPRRGGRPSRVSAWAVFLLLALVAGVAARTAAAYSISDPEYLTRDDLKNDTITLSFEGSEEWTDDYGRRSYYVFQNVPSGVNLSIDSIARSDNKKSVTLTLRSSGTFTDSWNLSIRANKYAFRGLDDWFDAYFGPIPVYVNTPRLRVGSVSGQATEAGGMASFPVELFSRPSQAVTVTVSSQDTGEGTVSPATLTFSTTTWNTAQTVTATGVDDSDEDGHVSWQVRLALSSGDTDFDGTTRDVDVTTFDNEPVRTLAPNRWEKPGVYGAIDVVTTHLRDEAVGQSITLIHYLQNIGRWKQLSVEACEWQAVTVGDPGATGTCHTLKPANTRELRLLSTHLTVGITPTQAMISNGGVVIKVAHPRIGDLMIKWVPLSAPIPTLVVSPAAVPENGGRSTVTATLDRTSTHAITITVSAAGVSPTAAGDFTLTGTMLTFAVGATTSTGTVTLAAVDDTAESSTLVRAAGDGEHRPTGTSGHRTALNVEHRPIWARTGTVRPFDVEHAGSGRASLPTRPTGDVGAPDRPSTGLRAM